MYPLDLKLHNNASVADWLGTATTACNVAAYEIEAVRSGKVSHARLEYAEELLVQALDEVRQVQARIDES